MSDETEVVAPGEAGGPPSVFCWVGYDVYTAAVMEKTQSIVWAETGAEELEGVRVCDRVGHLVETQKNKGMLLDAVLLWFNRVRRSSQAAVSKL